MGLLVYCSSSCLREDAMGDSSQTPTADQVRKQIDRGQAADKVAGVDPAAAPLGTDDEAGGNPPTPEQREMEARARRREAPRRPTAGGDATKSMRDAETPDSQTRSGAPPIDVDSVGGSIRVGEKGLDRGGRVAEVVPSREDDAAGTLNDDPSPPPRRRSVES
jgi:hypothetical protein